ncbi:hypothetical protein Cgig2_029221 [Carnegiea gigantea]|uniref:Uncharacterized protein n=1 Tax=Carnegiea gigantea TaxID=171969 RepID=A0A9Q1GU37_9CARY|nr:hypothetical protein Cgig2_029221 [Carnegiea gigantea]
MGSIDSSSRSRRRRRRRERGYYAQETKENSAKGQNRRNRAGKDGLGKFWRDSRSRKVRRRQESAAELAESDRNFRRTQHLDRKTKGNPSNPKTTTGEKAAGGSQRPKVHRTSGNPPMTTPGTLNSTAEFATCLPDAEEREKEGWDWDALRWLLDGPLMTGDRGLAAAEAWPD